MNKRARFKHAKRIAHYCAMSERELMEQMTFYTLNNAGKYLGWLQRPDSKILAVAHIDFLGTGRVHKASSEVVVSSALDDRLGVYMAMEAMPNAGIPCDVLLTDDEESAMSTMQGLGMMFLQRYNWMVQLDFPGEDVSTHGYKSMQAAVEELYGPAPPVLFTDISFVKDYSPIGAFNAPIGYMQQHTEQCYVNLRTFARCMEKLKVFYDRHHDTKFTEHDDLILTEAMHDSKYNLLGASTPGWTNNAYVVKGGKRDGDDSFRGYADYSYGGNDAAEWYETCTTCLQEFDVMDMEVYDGHYVCELCNRELTTPSHKEVPADDADNTRQARRRRAKGRGNS